MIRKISVLKNYLHTNIDKKQIKGLFYVRNEVVNEFYRLVIRPLINDFLRKMAKFRYQ